MSFLEDVKVLVESYMVEGCRVGDVLSNERITTIANVYSNVRNDVELGMFKIVEGGVTGEYKVIRRLDYLRSERTHENIESARVEMVLVNLGFVTFPSHMLSSSMLDRWDDVKDMVGNNGVLDSQFGWGCNGMNLDRFQEGLMRRQREYMGPRGYTPMGVGGYGYGLSSLGELDVPTFLRGRNLPNYSWRNVDLFSKVMTRGNSYLAFSNTFNRLYSAYLRRETEGVVVCGDGDVGITFIQDSHDDYVLIAFSDKYMFLTDSKHHNFIYYSLSRTNCDFGEMFSTLMKFIPFTISETIRIITDSMYGVTVKEDLKQSEYNGFDDRVVDMIGHLSGNCDRVLI